MNITLSVLGRFHTFALAGELQARNCLLRLITSQPQFVAAKYGIDSSRLASLVWHELHVRAWQHMPRWVLARYNPQFMLHELFDRAAAKRIPAGTEVFMGLSASSLYSMRRARALGARTVVQRGSSHILFQRDILLEEYARQGVEPRLPHPMVVDKELREYDEAEIVSIPSSFVRRTFMDRGISEAKLLQAAFGVDLERFSPGAKGDKKFRVVYCGNIGVRKGLPYLLEAFLELGLPDSELTLIGGMSDEFRPIMRKYASPQVVHKGPFPEFDLREHYVQGTVFCLPSIEEGMAMVLLQAMACGLPVICTPNTGGEDVVRDGLDGFIVPIRDVGALKEKLLHFYDHPEAAAEMGRSARARVESGYSWGDYAARMLAGFEKMTRGS